MFFAFIFYYFSFCIANQLPREIEKEYDGSNGQNEHRINNPNETISIQNTKFSNFNNANEDGGAVFVTTSYSNNVPYGGNCSIVGCEFLSCHAKNGGAMFIKYVGGYKFAFSISSTTITDCVATEKGGALYLSSNQYLLHSFSILNCTFNSNKAANGGAIHGAVRDQLIINDCNFNNNEATTSGCSLNLILGATSPKNVEHATFNITDNSFVFTPKEGNSTFNVHVENCKISKNSTVNVEISGCTFSANTPSIDTYYHLHVTEKEGNFESFVFNKCNCISQGIETISIPYSLYPLTNLAFECTSIGQCTPGGPIEVPDDPVKPPEGTSTPPGDQYEEHDRIISPLTENLLLTKCNFTGLKDDSSGGAIYIEGNKTYMYNATITKCIFNSCRSAIGGAIYAYFSGGVYFKFTIATSEFNECQATQNGGAVYIKNTQYQKHAFSISACTFISNKAANGGGVYGYVRDNLAIKNCNFSNNEATKGSSLWLILGQNNTKLDEYDTYDITGNTFTFAPKAESLNNVYLENIDITNTTQDPPSTYVNIGGNTFSISNEFSGKFNHLEINSVKTGFASINFNKCNCVQQDKTTFSVPDQYPIRNVNFGCTAIGSCSTKPEIPPSTPDYTTETNRIHEKGTEINVENTEFYKLTNSGSGGAIYMKDQRSNVSLNNCKFTLCQATTNGGAIYIYFAKDYYDCTIKKTTFSYCSANKDGGAAYIENTLATKHSFLFEDCKFESNEAGDQGGAMFAIVRDQLTITDCTFSDNYAQTEGSSIWMRIGNSNKNESDTITMTNNAFSFTPTLDAINVYVTSATSKNLVINPNLIIGGCTFSTTTTSNVQSFKHLQVIEVVKYESIQFTTCNCVHQGENTFSIPPQFKIENVQFGCTSIDSCDPSKPPTGGDGDSHERIEAPTAAIVLNNVKFSGLKFSGNGGAILINTSFKVNCSITNCQFISCSAKNGGAIYVEYAKEQHYFCSISGTVFTDCSATTNGGALYLKNPQYQYHSFDINKCTFKSNTAKLGGAIYGHNREQLTIKGCTFENNVATNGSSLWLKLGQDTPKIINDILEQDYYSIIDNKFIFAPMADKSINVHIENVGIKNTTKHDPVANLIIGGNTFSISNQFSSFTHLEIVSYSSGFASIKFSKCNCVNQGEKTFSVPSQYALENVIFGCTSIDSCQPRPQIPSDPNYKTITERYNEEGVNIDLSKVEFYQLKCEEDGGAIYMNKVRANISLDNCKFTLCEAKNGGAIYVQYAGPNYTYVATIKNTIFSYCSAKTHGGALYLKITQSDRHSATVTDCKFITNSATKNGGAVYADARDRFTLKNCDFEDNFATYNGSSLWCRVGWDSVYDDNVATIENNNFTFTPVNKDSVNVFISAYTLLTDVTPNANLVFGGCTFSATKEVSKYSHLKITHHRSQFESIKFTSCSCVKQGNTTVSLPLLYNPNYYFTFNCEGKCDAKPAEPTPTPAPDAEGYTPALDRINRVEFDPKVVITKVKFSNFVLIPTNRYGGAIYSSNIPCSIYDCKFDSCQSTRGGAIYAYYYGTLGNYTCSIVNSKFVNCNSTNGGAIYAYIVQPKRHYIAIEGCDFQDNRASNNGGAIYAQVRDCFSVQYCTFNNNKADLKGSSIWCRIGQDQGNDSDDRASFYGNTITFTPSETNTINVYIESQKITNETSPNANLIFGRNTLSATSTNVKDYELLEINEVGTFESIVFSECNCIQGAESSVNITAKTAPDTKNLIYNCQNLNQCPSGDEKPPETNDKCQSYPSRLESFKDEIEREKACFNNIVAPELREGGAVRSINAKVELENCHFTNCSTDSNGGAVYVSFSGSQAELEIKGCTFVSCYSGSKGGAVYYINTNPRCESTFENLRFEENKAANGAGAFYYSPCANSIMKKCFFVNNTCTNKKAQGSSLYVLVANENQNTLSVKPGKLAIKADDKIKPVIIEENRFRSEPAATTQQCYINLKKTGNLQFNTNSFSFNNATDIPKGTQYVYLSKDEGAVFKVEDDICVDSAEQLVGGFDESVKVSTDCHNADASKDDDVTEKDPGDGGKGGKKTNVGMIVGIVVAVVVVIAVVVVVVIFVIRKKSNKYISDLNEEEGAENISNNANTESNL